jgi:hypothetical protein
MISKDRSSARALLSSRATRNCIGWIGGNRCAHDDAPNLISHPSRTPAGRNPAIASYSLKKFWIVRLMDLHIQTVSTQKRRKRLYTDTGFAYACSSKRDVVYRRQDRYRLTAFLAQRLGRRSVSQRLTFMVRLIRMNTSLPAKTVVIILTYNQRAKTLECLSYLIGESTCFQVLVWDNGSQDGTVEAVREAYPQTTTHLHPEKPGSSGRAQCSCTNGNSRNGGNASALFR